MQEKTRSGEVYFVVVLRHLGLEREIAVLKVNGKNFYAFTPYSLSGDCHLDNHVSLHESGERHVVSRYFLGGKLQKVRRVRQESVVRFERPENLKGSVLIYLGGDPLGQFPDLNPAGTTKGKMIILDAEKAGFGDHIFVIKIYVVEPRNEECIPVAPDAGPRVLHFIKTTNPWIAVDVYQPKMDMGPGIVQGRS